MDKRDDAKRSVVAMILFLMFLAACGALVGFLAGLWFITRVARVWLYDSHSVATPRMLLGGFTMIGGIAGLVVAVKGWIQDE